MHVLITGGAGFIGSHLAGALCDRDWPVCVLDDMSTGLPGNLPKAARLLVGDVRDEACLRRALRGVDAVVHLAAKGSVAAGQREPAHLHDVNVEATARLVELARAAGVRRLVYASSCAVYGMAPAPQQEEAACRPLEPYAASKRAVELLAAEANGDMQAVGLRFFNVYGPRQRFDLDDAAVVPRFMAAVKAGHSVDVLGDGEQVRDFVHVSDAVAATVATLEAQDDLSGRVFNVGTGVGTSVARLVQQVARVCARPLVARRGPSRQGEIQESRAEVSSAATELGFRAQVSLEEGLASTWAWVEHGCTLEKRTEYDALRRHG